MKEYLVAIINRIRESAFYNGVSYHAVVESAVEVESIEDKADRKIARREFEAEHGLTAQVWSRIPKRFPNYKQCKAQAVKSLSYMCQLSQDDCMDLYIANKDHLDEKNAHLFILQQVDEIKERKQAARNGKPRKDRNGDGLAERIGSHIFNNEIDKAHELICDEPEIAKDLARREAEQAEAFPEVAAVLARKAEAK